MSLFARLSEDAVAPVAELPEPGTVISGDPRFTTWSIEERDGKIYSGIWEATPGKWAVDFTEWEYCRILTGRSLITSESGEAFEVGPGDGFMIRPGFKGTWEVLETTRKQYVIVN